MNSYSAGGDPYGDGGGVPNGVATPNVADDTYAASRFDPYQFTAAGTPVFPSAGDMNDHSSASFIYSLTAPTPEPSSIVLWGLGVAASLLAYRRRKA